MDSMLKHTGEHARAKTAPKLEGVCRRFAGERMRASGDCSRVGGLTRGSGVCWASSLSFGRSVCRAGVEDHGVSIGVRCFLHMSNWEW